MHTYVNYIGMVAGACTTLSLIPQIMKIVKTHSVSDLSLIAYAIACSGMILWIIYGFFISSLSLVCWNIVTLLLSCTIVVLKIMWGRKS